MSKISKGVSFLKDQKRVKYGVKKKSAKGVSKSKPKSRLKKLPELEDRKTKSLSLFQSDLDVIAKIDLQLRNRGIQLNTSQILRLCLRQFEFDEFNTVKITDNILEHYRNHKYQSSVARKRRQVGGKRKRY